VLIESGLTVYEWLDSYFTPQKWQLDEYIKFQIVGRISLTEERKEQNGLRFIDLDVLIRRSEKKIRTLFKVYVEYEDTKLIIYFINLSKYYYNIYTSKNIFYNFSILSWPPTISLQVNCFCFVFAWSESKTDAYATYLNLVIDSY
jgi:hypothetical protein